MSLGPDGVFRSPREKLAFDRKKSRWVALAAIVLVVLVVLVDLPSHVTLADRQGDLRTFQKSIATDLAGCNAGLSDSLSAYSGIASGSSSQVSIANQIMTNDEPVCTIAGNSDIYDLATMAPPNTLAHFGLEFATNDAAAWADPNAAQMIKDAQALLANRSDLGAIVDIRSRFQTMQKLLAETNSTLHTAAVQLNMNLAPITLDGLYKLPASLQ